MDIVKHKGRLLVAMCGSCERAEWVERERTRREPLCALELAKDGVTLQAGSHGHHPGEIGPTVREVVLRDAVQHKCMLRASQHIVHVR